MRELIFKNLTAPTSKKREISVEEVVNTDGLVSSTKKRSIYFVMASHRIKSKSELKAWIDKKRKDSDLNRKFFHILRDYSDERKEDKLICKMRGSFYVVAGESVYNIVFVHAIKIVHKMDEKGK